ncbi:MAG: hypothetical protein ABI727_06935 [Nitrosospira sp.]
MHNSRAKEMQLWWPLPLAALLWLIIIWGFGFLLSTPKVENEAPPPIEASFVELPEEKKEQKLPAAPKTPKTPPTQPRLGAPGAKSTKPSPEKGTGKKEAQANRSPAPKQDTPKDLADFMKEARERRTAGGIFEDEPTKPETVEREPSEEERRMANVKRNLRETGTSGIFQITRMGPRNAQFLFRAWRTDISNPRREVVEVQAGPDGDIQRAIVRKMIDLIRQYHKGDFQWESYRFGVVTLSSRMEDSKGLEDFLIREFFEGPMGVR